MPRLSTWPLCVVFAIAFGGVPVSAGTWFVDDDAVADPGPQDPAVSDPKESGSEAHPFDTIQEAINLAEHGDEIMVMPGVYFGPGNSAFNFFGKRVVLRGDATDRPIIQGAEQPCMVRFENGEDEHSVLESIELVGGYTGVCCAYSSPILRDVSILNQADFGVDSKGGSPQLFNMLIRWCMAGGARLSEGLPVVESSTFHEGGGGIECLDGDICAVRDCLISSNGRAEGAGVRVVDSELLLADSQLISNSAHENGGGLAVSNGKVAVHRCHFRYNGANHKGGAIHLRNSVATISNSRFEDNQFSEFAGAIWSQDSDLELRNSLLIRNFANEVGGIVVAGGTGLIRNSTVAFHDGLAALRVEDAKVRVRSSIFWDHFMQQGAIIEGDADVAFSLVMGGHTGLGNIGDNPKFAATQSDLKLQTTSPCVNRGDPEYEAEPDEADLPGETRVQQCRVDMGAYETAGMDDCNQDSVSDACELFSGSQTDCNGNSKPDDCDLDSPPVVFADALEEYPPDPLKWPSHNLEEVQFLGAQLYPGAFLENRSFDLSAALFGRLSFHVYTQEGGWGWLDVDCWDGSGWKLVRREKTSGNGLNVTRVLDLPRWALRSDARIRFRNPMEDFQYADWHVQDVSIVRVEGDCDGDGDLEVCALSGEADCNHNQFPDKCDIGRLLFGHRYDYSVGEGPQSLAIADFDNDGDPDIMAGRGRPAAWGYFRLLLNDGTGLFTTAEELDAGFWPRSVAIADFDGNAGIDITTATAWQKNFGGIWWGFADDFFALPIQNIDLQPQSAATGDLDTDGDADIVGSYGGLNEGPGEVRAFLNDGHASFLEADRYTGGGGLRSVALADFDRDGDLDVALTVQLFEQGLVVLANLGVTLSGEWLGLDEPQTYPTALPFPNQPFQVATADVDGDGWLDAIVVNAGYETEEEGSVLAVLLNQRLNENGEWLGFADPIETPVFLAPFGLSTGDVDGDGDVDVAVAAAGTDSVVLFRNLGSKGAWFGWDEPMTLPSGSHPTAVRLIDLNADGALDLVVANRAINSGNSTVGTPSVAVFLQSPPYETDCNQNGIPDSCDAGEGTPDCDADAVFDACEADCNSNEIVDDCELLEGTSLDCNHNGVPDECDISAGTSADCDADGLLDECVVSHTFVASSGILTPLITDVDVPQEFTLRHPEAAADDVTLSIITESALDFDEHVMQVWVNDAPVGFVRGVTPSTVCPRVDRGGTPYSGTILVPKDLYNYLLFDGHITVRVQTINAGYCFSSRGRYSEPYARIRVEYPVIGSKDCNDSGHPDTCEVLDGRSIDLSGDFRPDECEGLGDANNDHVVNHADLTDFEDCLAGPGPFRPQQCFDLDFDRDGAVDLRDFSGFQMVFGFERR